MVIVAGALARLDLGAPAGRVFSPVRGPVSRLNLAAAPGDVIAFDISRAELVLTLTLLNDIIDSPGVLSVNVGNGAELGIAYFFYDAAATPFLEVELDDTGAQRSIYLSVANFTAGEHTVRVSSTATPPTPNPLSSKTFTVAASNDALLPATPVEQVPPLVVAPGRWVFQAYDFNDINAVRTYMMVTNPTSMRRSFGNAAITSEPTTVSNGRIISWEGASKPPTWSFSGHVLTLSEHQNLMLWGQTGQRFYITDHFSQRYLVKVTRYEVERVRDLQRPWHHTYQMDVAVLGGVGVFGYGIRTAPVPQT